jgi:hypothetical protein
MAEQIGRATYLKGNRVKTTSAREIGFVRGIALFKVT